jgi:hypothetical protein
LLTRIKSCITLLESADTFAATTVRNNVNAVLSAYTTAVTNVDTYSQLANLVSVANSTSSATTIPSVVQNLISNDIITAVQADRPQLGTVTIQQAIDEVESQMIAAGSSIQKNVTSATAAFPASKPCFAVTNLRANGTATEVCFAETFLCTPSGNRLLINGTSVDNPISSDWPGGSGSRLTLTTTPSGGFVVNGVFDDIDPLVANKPASWTVLVGTIGTTLSVTDYETQIVTVAGSPVSGYYTLTLSDADGNQQTTAPIPFNGTNSQVSTAIRSVSGFEAVAVDTTGTGPNYTHTIKFNNLPGDIPAIVPNNFLNTGTVTQTNGAAVDTSGLANTALVFTGNGSQLTSIEQPLFGLSASQQYGFHVRLKRTAGATGIIAFRLIDGTGAVINDAASTANSLSVNLTSVGSSSYTAHTAFFRMPANLPSVVKLQCVVTTAISNTGKLYLDEMTIASPTSIGATGLSAILFSHPKPILPTDSYTLSTANNLAGRIQKTFFRFFQRQLPSSASPSISDT